MSAIPGLFIIAHSTILKPVIGGTSPAMSNAHETPNDNPIHVIQLSFFTCLFIISLFLILTTLSLGFILFLYTRDTRQSIARQELVWVMRYRKWLEMIPRPPIKRSRHDRKRRTIHHRCRSRRCCDQSFSSLHKQGSDSS